MSRPDKRAAQFGKPFYEWPDYYWPSLATWVRGKRVVRTSRGLRIQRRTVVASPGANLADLPWMEDRR